MSKIKLINRFIEQEIWIIETSYKIKKAPQIRGLDLNHLKVTIRN